MFRRLFRILVILLGPVLASAAVAAPAVAQPTATITVTGGTLAAKGAAVDVAVLYSCSSDTGTRFASVTLTQRVSAGRVATGSGGTSDVVCDGVEHTTTVPVTPNGGLAFKKGEAHASAYLNVCDASFNCSMPTFSGTIRIR
jgi:hypothetical protein